MSLRASRTRDFVRDLRRRRELMTAAIRTEARDAIVSRLKVGLENLRTEYRLARDGKRERKMDALKRKILEQTRLIERMEGK